MTMAEIFISYAREDRQFVDSLAEALASASHDVWFDRDLGPGLFRDQITARLMAAEVVIVVWSRRSQASRYVLDESERAASRGALLPLRIDKSDIPLGFGPIQTFDFSEWSGLPDDPKFKTLLDQIARLANPSGGPQTRPAVRFAARALLLAAAASLICAPALVYLHVAARASTAPPSLADFAEALALSLACLAPVMLWCGFQVSRFGLSRTKPILRRAARIYGLSAILSLVIIVAAVAAGATSNLPAAAAVAQLAFVGLLATLISGSVVVLLSATGHLIGRMRA
jgi:hypothetical protein